MSMNDVMLVALAIIALGETIRLVAQRRRASRGANITDIGLHFSCFFGCFVNYCGRSPVCTSS